MQSALFEKDSILLRFPFDNLATYVLRILTFEGKEDPVPSDGQHILHITEFF